MDNLKYDSLRESCKTTFFLAAFQEECHEQLHLPQLSSPPHAASFHSKGFQTTCMNCKANQLQTSF